LLTSNSPTYTTPTITKTTAYYAGVISTTGCVSSTRTAVSAYVFKTVPATPGVITASSPTACSGTTVTYSVPSVAGVDYNWTVPISGATLLSGQNSNSISVLYGASAAGTLSVNAFNGCGASVASSSLVISTTGCGALSAATGEMQAIEVNPRKDTIIRLDAKVAPNPSATKFTVILSGNSNKPVEMRVVDMYGRSVYYARGSANQSYEFGERFTGGVYIVQILQGELVKTLKVVKAK